MEEDWFVREIDIWFIANHVVKILLVMLHM
jgi:hypothetical protein